MTLDKIKWREYKSLEEPNLEYVILPFAVCLPLFRLSLSQNTTSHLFSTSFNPMSFDPMSSDPMSFDPMSF